MAATGEWNDLKELTQAAVGESRRLIPTRRTLLSRLKDWRDDASWKTFFDTYWKLIYNMSRKAGLNDAESQDVVQETVISVCLSIPEFRYDPEVGSFQSWLMKLTGWRIADQFRKRMPNGVLSPAQGASGEDFLACIPDESAQQWDDLWMAEWEKNLVERAIHAVKHQVKPKQYQVFELHYFKKWDLTRIAKELKVTRTWVYVVHHRLAGRVAKELRRLNAGE